MAYATTLTTKSIEGVTSVSNCASWREGYVMLFTTIEEYRRGFADGLGADDESDTHLNAHIEAMDRFIAELRVLPYGSDFTGVTGNYRFELRRAKHTPASLADA